MWLRMTNSGMPVESCNEYSIHIYLIDFVPFKEMKVQYGIVVRLRTKRELRMQYSFRKICGSHSGNWERFCLLGSNIVQWAESNWPSGGTSRRPPLGCRISHARNQRAVHWALLPICFIYSKNSSIAHRRKRWQCLILVRCANCMVVCIDDVWWKMHRTLWHSHYGRTCVEERRPLQDDI
jgi:hypothetical protein